MLRWYLIAACLCLATSGSAQEQQATYGFSVPVTASATLVSTSATRTDDGLETTTRPAARVVVSPTARVGPHWFFYSAIAVNSATFFNGESSNYDEGMFSMSLMQAFVGYSANAGKTSWLFKAGRLSSAFGLAPVEYDDATMPFVRPMPAYTSALMLPADQLACGSNGWAHPNGTTWSSPCKGSEAENYGLTPVTLYGVPGVEFQLATNSFDGRVQFTNSSPANPQGLTSNNQHLQWTLRGGYRFGPGIHVGVSEFFGPYLDGSLEPVLPVGQNLGHFNALGLGLDAQWSRGPWALEGEWQRFRFELPGFAQSPRVEVAYGQAKRIISPRVFAATRLSAENFSAISDQEGFRLPNFQAPRKAVEVSLAYRPNRLQVIKAGLGLSTFTSSSLSGYPWKYTVEIELVTSFVPLAKSFR